MLIRLAWVLKEESGHRHQDSFSETFLHMARWSLGVSMFQKAYWVIRWTASAANSSQTDRMSTFELVS